MSVFVGCCVELAGRDDMGDEKVADDELSVTPCMVIVDSGSEKRWVGGQGKSQKTEKKFGYLYRGR